MAHKRVRYRALGGHGGRHLPSPQRDKGIVTLIGTIQGKARLWRWGFGGGGAMPSDKRNPMQKPANKRA
jgi:hypothetical protein